MTSAWSWCRSANRRFKTYREWTPKVRLVPSLTSYLSSTLRRLDQTCEDFWWIVLFTWWTDWADFYFIVTARFLRRLWRRVGSHSLPLALVLTRRSVSSNLMRYSLVPLWFVFWMSCCPVDHQSVKKRTFWPGSISIAFISIHFGESQHNNNIHSLRKKVN